MELKDYTTEELESEIKRRKKEERANRPKRETQYVYAKGTIRKIYGRKYSDWEYYVDIDEEDQTPMSKDAIYHFKHREVKLDKKKFSKKTAPDIGDRVLIQSKITRDNPTGWGVWFNPRIIKVLED